MENMSDVLKVLGKSDFNGVNITYIEGGFGKGKKFVLGKDIAEIHGKPLSEINRRINDNKKRFVDGVDIIDLLNGSESFRNLATSNGWIGSNRTKHVYILSERGYSKLIKIMDDDKSWEVHDKLVDEYFQLKVENKQLQLDNKELHKIAVSDEEQSERKYMADKIRHSWKNIRTVLNNCTYKTIEDEVNNIIYFHCDTLKKKDRCNYDSHKNADNTTYKQLVRERVYSVLDDIYNSTLDGTLRTVVGDIKETVLLNKISTINRSNSMSNHHLKKQIESVG